MRLFHSFSKYLNLALMEGQLLGINLLSGPDSDLCPVTHFESSFWPAETGINTDNFCADTAVKNTECRHK
ncbi:hypothetical protein MACH26_22680 [Planctobacterium marinum]|uniref:Uncharacterized protein n=1 Tax=Planctobacterium marinum TaxID=1631968 RepID=A0AA48HQC7_9ALTE|nr:hypothetical protein MACH26_22680 [Planctobacterium marinum]